MKDDFLNHYTYKKLEKHISMLKKEYPYMKLNIIGTSVLEKNIYEITIGKGSYKTHFNASFHGNEWITSAILMKCTETYLQKIMTDDTYKHYFNTHTLSIVPMVNPDGVNLVINGITAAQTKKDTVLQINNNDHDFSNWKANINGVDLNKQFPAKWEIEKNRLAQHPYFRDYPGKSPLSEREAMIMATLMDQNKFERMHALHTQGEEIYWGFNELEPTRAKEIVKDYEKVTRYKAVRYINNYAGLKDWFIQKYRKPGFTIELGKGVNPLPFDQFNQMYRAMWQIFTANFKWSI